jgi:phenylalanyl-tRNA synthetase beta chain
MNIFTPWLERYAAPLPSAEQLGERFTMTSSEVESIERFLPHLNEVRVARTLAIHPHPNSTKLQILTVDLGVLGTREIVTGAPGVRVGALYPLALPGTTLHPLKGDPITLGEREIRGVVSPGMLCGADELGLSAVVTDGLLELAESATPGESVLKALGLEDASVIDLSLTPNRPDLFSYIGLAREVAAFYPKARFTEPALASLELAHPPLQLTAKIHDQTIAKRLTAVALALPAQLPETPLWMQLALQAAGIRPINLVVDITNYVTLEYGQPMHAFDRRAIGEGSKITIGVGTVADATEIPLLNGKTYTLVPGDPVLVSTDGVALDLGGIMGGAMMSVKEDTAEIVLQATCFPGPVIRRASRRHGIRTEASSRNEKGTDPELTITALKRAVYLLQELGGMKQISNLADTSTKAAKSDRPRIHLSVSRVHEILGTSISPTDCRSILQRLGFYVASINKAALEVVAPTWRADVRLEEDLIEEIVRIWGFERVPATIPSGPIAAPQPHTRFYRLQKIREIAAARGITELVVHPFASERELVGTRIAPTEAVALPNPLSAELAYLVPSHLPTLLRISTGWSTERPEATFMTYQSVFQAGPTEEKRLGILLRTQADHVAAYRTVRGHIEALLGSCEFQAANDEELFHPGTTTTVLKDGVVIGRVGAVHPAVLQYWKIRTATTVWFAELAIAPLLTAKLPATFSAAGGFPAIIRDVTLQRPVTTESALVAAEVQAAVASLPVEGMSLKDRYVSAKNPEVQALTYTIVFRHPERSLTDEEVNAALEQLQ